jgi:hypothetical protein
MKSVSQPVTGLVGFEPTGERDCLLKPQESQVTEVILQILHSCRQSPVVACGDRFIEDFLKVTLPERVVLVGHRRIRFPETGSSGAPGFASLIWASVIERAATSPSISTYLT